MNRHRHWSKIPDGASIEEIALALNISKREVCNILENAKRKLKRKLNNSNAPIKTYVD